MPGARDVMDSDMASRGLDQLVPLDIIAGKYRGYTAVGIRQGRNARIPLYMRISYSGDADGQAWRTLLRALHYVDRFLLEVGSFAAWRSQVPQGSSSMGRA